MTETEMPMVFRKTRATLDCLRDGLLLLVLGMLLLFPETVDNILSRAGFMRASMFGFDWEKQLDDSTQETAVAQQTVQSLLTELGRYEVQIDGIAPSVTDPAGKREVASLAAGIRTSKSNAEQVGAQLGRNLVKQAELKSQLKSRIRP